mmetsp:Transcript_9712/g.11191  ORF Transcript_9712/g.11191 Transcript_9712/m.11191 type:complete len:213 (-) Transcript_9712:370-1008(-)
MEVSCPTKTANAQTSEYKPLSDGFLQNIISRSPKPELISDKIKSLKDEDFTVYAQDLDNAPIRLPWKEVSYLNKYDGMILGELLRHPEVTWRKLGVQFNLLKDEGAIAILQGLRQNQMLEQIFLEGNQLTDHTAEVVAMVLKENKTLKTIHLDFNRMTDAGLKMIAQGLTENTSLELLDISFNQFSAEGKTLLRNVAKTKPKFSLWINVPCP